MSTIVSDNVAIDTSLGSPIINSAWAIPTPFISSYHSAGLNCDKEHLWNINHSSWQEFPSGDTTITCTATDTSGNIGTASFTVTAVYEAPADTTPPVITLNWAQGGAFTPTIESGNVFVTINTGDAAFVGFSISSDGGEEVSCENARQTVHSAFFNIGTTTVTCTASDVAGNVGTMSFTVTVLEDSADTTPVDTTAAATEVVVTTIFTSETNVVTAPEIVVPSWIKNNAGWWASDQITDSDFVLGLQWLISNGIMSIPPTEQGAASDNVIPSWIKNNAEWWADGLIDNFAFVTGLQWLITNGIMVIG
jgi:hypothetical protein